MEQKKTILSIIGARPQFIKHAPMQIQLAKFFNALTLHTGQHYDPNMSDVFFKELGMPEPNYLLSVGGSKPQGEQTGIMVTEIEKVCTTLKPHAILLYGDTNSTLAGALVASKMGIKCIHIEAGLRSYNRQMPEEINRIIADNFSDLLFCPTPQAIQNLNKEGISHEGIQLCGDVMCDMIELVKPQIKPLYQKPYYFATIHRPYNTDDPERMERLLQTLNKLDKPVFFPIHPRTIARLEQWKIEYNKFNNIRCIAPVGYIDSISYQAFSDCVITDSGGMQKEAYILKKKCITVRSETEWGETMHNNWNTLVFDNIESIQKLVHEKPGAYKDGIYGDGNAAAFITDVIYKTLNAN